MLANLRILLVISGGIAAYKSLELIRSLKGGGACVHPILTRSGAQFVTPLSVPHWRGKRSMTIFFRLPTKAKSAIFALPVTPI